MRDFRIIGERSIIRGVRTVGPNLYLLEHKHSMSITIISCMLLLKVMSFFSVDN